MENIKEKYQRLRPQVGDGCIGLISKNEFVSKAIRWADASELSHVLIVFSKANRLFCIDSNTNGVRPDLLSERINLSDNVVFIKPLCSEDIIQMELEKSFKRAENKIRYDFINGGKEFANRASKNHKFVPKMNFEIKPRDQHDICSDWVREFQIATNMVTSEFLSLPAPFPQDSLRYRDINNTELIG